METLIWLMVICGAGGGAYWYFVVDKPRRDEEERRFNEEQRQRWENIKSGIGGNRSNDFIGSVVDAVFAPVELQEAKFKNHIAGRAPQEIIDMFLEVERVCTQAAANPLALLQAIRERTIVEKIGSSIKEAEPFYDALIRLFDVVLALIPPYNPAHKGRGLSVSLRDLDGSHFSNTLRMAMRGIDAFAPIMTHLANNRIRFDAMSEKVKYKTHEEAHAAALSPKGTQPTDPYEVTKYLLAGTPFARLPDLTFPFTIPDEAFYSHGFILGQQGKGKTTLIECLAAQDLVAVAQGELSLILMDSQGDQPGSLLYNIQNLKAFAKGGSLDGKLLVIGPDVEHPLQLNPFQMGKARLDTYNPRERTIIRNHTMDLMTYVFNSLLGEGTVMTSKQDTLFRYSVRLCLEIPDASVATLVALMRPKGIEPYRKYVPQLDPMAQDFFNHQFDAKGQYEKTKEEMGWRLSRLLEDETFAAMLCAPECRIDLYDQLAQSKVIVINTDKALLGDTRCALFGRLWIAMLLSAAQERANQPRDTRLPVHCYIDEAHDYIKSDPNITTIFDQARKQKVGVICAAQRCSQMTDPKVLDALLTTQIKFVNTNNSSDTGRLAPYMQTTAEFLNQPTGNFAANVGGFTENGAVSVVVPNGLMANAPKMSAQEKQEIMEEMRRRYCYPANRSPPPPPRSPPPSRSGSPSKARPPDEPEWKKHAREDIRRLPPPDVKPGNW